MTNCCVKARIPVMIVFSIIAVLACGGIVASFVLMDIYRESGFANVCNLRTGNCTDIATDDGIDAWVDVAIKVGECAHVNYLQMRSSARNCAAHKPDTTLRYNERYYIVGAFSCHTASWDRCIWDGGEFEQRDTTLLTTGIVSSVVFVFTLVPAMTLLSIIIKDRKATWSFQTKNIS
ncbi:hypothetical protein D5b_00021 [Faustovirus]|nr:hypothetical protein D5b_00021 [Faustovirus]AMN84888.1 hypothetical protein D6_00489 [Faustovirus]AMP43981.1 hypothetical protein PRJ_Dakar_00021 [Faustovirus]